MRFGRLCSTAFLLSLGGLLLGSGVLSAQGAEGDCDVPDHRGVEYTTQSNGARIALFHFPTIRCSSGTWINADSARIYEANNYTQLFGHVIFRDAETRLTAAEARYFTTERRLRAWGTAVLSLSDSSEFRGDTMLLERAGPNREVDVLTVTGAHPHATLYPKRTPPPPPEEEAPEGIPVAAAAHLDTLGNLLVIPNSLGPERMPLDSLPQAAVPQDSTVAVAPPPRTLPTPTPATEEEEGERIPYEIDAQRFFLRGTGFFVASGGVLIQRDSLNAVADSLEYDESGGALLLFGDGQVKTSSYTLSGEDVRLDIPQDEIRYVDAREHALLEGEDLSLLAPAIAIFLEEGKMERLVARRDTTGAEAETPEGVEPPELPGHLERALRELGLSAFPPRPFALAQDFQMVADSIEVMAPGEVLNQVLAMGRARGVSFARDSLNTPETPAFMLHDWLEGDTIVAVFTAQEDSVAAGPEDPEASMPVRVNPAEAEPDSTGRKYRLDRMVAKVAARSFYRLEASDSTVAAEEKRLAIHYVMGDEITITMTEGEVDRMEVTGQTMGLHGEPTARRKRGETPPDSAGAAVPPDTAGGTVPPDTARGTRPPDTTRARVPPDTTLSQLRTPQNRDPGPGAPGEDRDGFHEEAALASTGPGRSWNREGEGWYPRPEGSGGEIGE